MGVTAAVSIVQREHCPLISASSLWSQTEIGVAQTSRFFSLLIIKIWDVVVGVAPVAFGSEVGDSQVIEAWKENQDSDDQDRDCAIGSLEGRRGGGRSQASSEPQIQQ